MSNNHKIKRIDIMSGSSGFKAELYMYDKDGWSVHYFTNVADLLEWLDELLSFSPPLPPSGSA